MKPIVAFSAFFVLMLISQDNLLNRSKPAEVSQKEFNVTIPVEFMTAGFRQEDTVHDQSAVESINCNDAQKPIYTMPAQLYGKFITNVFIVL